MRATLPILVVCSVLAAALASAPHVEAATRTWDGGGGDNNWSTPANWSADTLPVAGDTVTFNGTSTKNATIDPAVVSVAVFQVNAGYTGVISQGAGDALSITTSYTQSAGTFTAGNGTTSISVTGGTTVNSGGTFNGGSSTLSLTGALTVNAGGLFTSTSGTLTVTGAVTFAALVFTHNSGSVVLSTSNATLNLGLAATFNNVQFLSGTKTISAANIMTVLGTLTLTGGAVNTGTIAAQGDIAVASTFTGGSGTLLINGGGAQAWSDSFSVTADLPIVSISKGGGTLTMTGTFRTTRNWTWTAGTMAASASTVIFAAALTVTGSHTLGAVEMAGGTVTIAAGTILTATGTVTLTSGTIATGTLAAQGDISAAVGFTGGSGTLSINGGGAQLWNGGANTTTSDLPIVSISKGGGTLTMTGTFRTSRAWSWSAGTMAASASTVTFTGQTITGSHTLGAVTMAGGTVTIAAGTILTATGTVTLTSGTIATGTLAAQGDISAASGFTGGSGTLLINGGAGQAWSGAAIGTSDLPIVSISKGGGTLTMTGTFRTTHNWTWTAGTMAAAGSTVTFTGQTITGSHTLGAVTIAGGTVTIAAGTILTASGTVDLFSGTVNTGTLAALGDVNAEIGFTGGGTATLSISGGGAQQFTGFHNSTTGALPNLDISKPSGALILAGTLRTGRNWTYTAAPGGLTVTGSTVVFTGQTITGSHALNAVEIRGGTVTIAAATILTATGNVLLFSGSFGGTGTLEAQANVDAQSGFTGGTATLLIDSGGPQTLNQAAIASSSLPVVTIAKPSGMLTMTGTFRTNRNWTWTSGGLTAAGTTIQFAGTMTITGTHTLDAVEIAGTITIAGGSIVTANSTVTLTSGSLSTGTLAARADIIAAVGYTGGGSGTLLINGIGPQTLTGFHSTVAGSMPNVNISKGGGTLTIAGTIRTARDWTYTGGGLAVAGSTVIFNGTQTVTGSHTLDTVEVRGGALTIAAGTTLTVTGPLNLFSGSLQTGTLAAEGNIDAQIGFTGGGTATLRIDGATGQTLTGFHTAAAGSMPNVDIAKPSGTLTIAGTVRTARNWTYTSGGLFASGSTVIFNGTLTITGSHALNAVEFHSGDVTVNAGDTLTVGGLLTLTDGNLNVGTVDALGDIVLQATYDGETGTVRIAGTTDQTLTGFAGATTSDMANIVIDKPSGTLHLVGTIRLTTSSWTWLQGTVDPGSSTVYFDATVTISGTHSLYNVYLSGGAHTVTGGDVLTALGTLTLDNGTIDGGTIAGAGPITQLSTFDGGSGLLAITGGSSHTFTGSATTAAGNLPDVQINTSGGTLTLAGTIRTANDWTHLAGTVDPDGSTVVFAGTLSVDAGPMPFNDVLVNAGTVTLTDNLTTRGSLTVAAGTLAIGSHTVFAAGDVAVNAGLTVTTGILDMNGLTGQTLGGTAAIGLYDLTVNDAAGVTQTTSVSVAGTLDLGGPLTFNGQSLSIAHAITGAPNNLAASVTSTLIITGTGSGIIIPASLTDLLNLTLTNPNGAALAGPLTVDGIFTLGGGNLDAGSFVLSIGPTGSVSRTSGHVVGALEKWVPLGSGVTVVYEIGDATTYAPVSLTFGTVGITGQLTASTTAGEHPSIGTSIIDPAQDVNRWWRLFNAGVDFDTLDATFTFAATDVDPGADTSRFIVAKWDGSWGTPGSGANTATTITAYAMTSLSEFAVGEQEADLSVDIAASAPSIVLGSSVHITLAVSNDGPADATDVRLTITLPPGSSAANITSSQGPCLLLLDTIACGLGPLASGAGATVAFDDIPAAAGGAAFAAAVTGDQSDPVSGNDGDALIVNVLLAATPTPTLPDASLSTWSPGGIGAVPLWISAWVLVLLTLAIFGVRRPRPHR